MLAMALIYNTLRSNLLALFAWFGVMVLAVLVWNLSVAVLDHFRVRTEIAREVETDAMIRLSYDLRVEDMAVFQSLSSERPLLAPQAAARVTDAALDAATDALRGHDDGEHGAGTGVLGAVRAGLVAQRGKVAAAKGGDPAERAAALAAWRRHLDTVYPRLEDITHDLIAETRRVRAQLAPVTALRYYTLFVFRGLIANRFAIEDLLQDPRPDPENISAVAGASGQLGGAANLAEDQFVADATPALRKVAAATQALRRDYLPAEARLLQGAASGRLPGLALSAWRIASLSQVKALIETESALRDEATRRLNDAADLVRTSIGLWLAAVVIAIALILQAVSLTLHRIVRPLEDVHAMMLRLAHDDLTVKWAVRPQLTEIQAMYDALTVFRENGLKRERMQGELARLNDRVVAANHAMTSELEAAALVQAAQLPRPCDLPGARFDTLYRPSRMIAGDTYDFVTLPDGRTRLFQIDVSGHGAAAALVSVISHIAVKTAVQEAALDEPLTDIVARINREWNEKLPYFTMLLIEIDPRVRLARVVQAGHPPLLRLPSVGGVETVGDGGMPVGALPWAEFEELTCAFHPGDRLVLTTDGVTEAADGDGEQFGDDRYRKLLERYGRGDLSTFFAGVDAALWDWCGTEAFDDDVTILVLQAKDMKYAH